ncbi:uncharacterized protein BDR25DRAFT_378633 [Lindgomyces ingoldianus]|uniref:Uncharacterized protein n=1 Tax=Lindgomyces ingoldianus TaxID=673940 RepID=A0ACB6QER8_9PLEO|nr:uncharacterized protein BDR25DRAFT_378633 [Lindgomyces ingoldianus]KAF2465478.1 hypothetical protein BDR25DRAFT_378633 [Lindgomyces ingoldianus]
MDPGSPASQAAQGRRILQRIPDLTLKTYIVGLQKSFMASKKLQRALGLQGGPVVPFAAPPPVPGDLVEAYNKGLSEFVWESSSQSEGISAVGYSQLGSDDGSGEDGGISWNGGRTPLLMRSEEYLVLGEDTGYERVVSEISDVDETRRGREECIDADEDIETESATFVPSKHVDELQLSGGHYDTDTKMEAGIAGSSSSYTTVPASSLETGAPASNFLSSLTQLAETTTKNQLEPSRQPQPVIVIISPDQEQRGSRKRPKARDSPETMSTQSTPRSRRRPGKKRRGDSVQSFTTLPITQAHAWKTPFPGNTENLAHTLLNWHSVMHHMYSNASQPDLLAFHPMFAFKPSKPKSVPLVAASFWSTGSEPHKELYRIEAGDVARLLYKEVDTFAKRREMESDKEKGNQKVGLREIFKKKDVKGKEPRDVSLTTDGRWRFLVIRGHLDANEEYEELDDGVCVAPYAILAFPTTAVTYTSESLFNCPPESPPEPASTTPERPALSRFASMPMLSRAFSRSCASVRATSTTNLNGPKQLSIPSLQTHEVPKATPPPALLRRTLLWFEIAGHVPLVEGYRTDTFAWRPFLEAVGRGEGKIQLWSEPHR